MRVLQQVDLPDPESSRWWEGAFDLFPLPATLAVVVLVLYGANRLLRRDARGATGRQFRNQLIMLGLTLGGLLAAILALPISIELRKQLLSFLGIVASAAIALSATSILGNAMAGLMLRMVQGFRLGDFLRIGEHFGRVTERGLVHTELQTEDSDLTTLPNLYLVTQPFTVIRASGTIVSATISLGYEVPRTVVEGHLLEAARQSELDEPFVQVLELGDFSVTYRVAGRLSDVTRLISRRSGLRKAMMDELHEGGIEIVSPTFMNTRAVDERESFIPERVSPAAKAASEDAHDSVIFEKAEEAASIERLRKECEKLDQEIESSKQGIKSVEDEQEKATLKDGVTRLETRRELLVREIEKREEEMKSEGEGGGG